MWDKMWHQRSWRSSVETQAGRTAALQGAHELGQLIGWDGGDMWCTLCKSWPEYSSAQHILWSQRISSSLSALPRLSASSPKLSLTSSYFFLFLAPPSPLSIHLRVSPFLPMTFIYRSQLSVCIVHPPPTHTHKHKPTHTHKGWKPLEADRADCKHQQLCSSSHTCSSFLSN